MVDKPHSFIIAKVLFFFYNNLMFNSLSGIITAKLPKQVFIETNGIEWDLCVPDSNLDMLPPVGNEARVFTWLQHTDQLMTLYGFASADERSLFLDLLKVDGVGPKGAVKIMSSVSSSRLMEILENGDLEMLEKIPGVGKKTAGKMILTLKGKLKLSENTGVAVVRVAAAGPYADVVSSLASMGYDKRLVEQKIAQLVEVLSGQSDFAEKSQKEREDLLFRRALVELA
jgi:Holliday junction DNA helicase RuvA